jgi:hypothetical protein
VLPPHTSVLEKSIVSNFYPEDAAGSFSKTMITIYQTTWHHISKDQDLNNCFYFLNKILTT